MERNWVILPWREKTWGERGKTVIANLLAAIVGLVMLFSALWVLGRAIDVQTERSMERRHCLKNATNGLEIEKCR